MLRILLISFWFFVVLCPGAAAAERTLGVVILHSGQPESPLEAAMDQGIRNELQQLGRPVSVVSEYLDAVRHDNPEYMSFFAELLRRKYGPQRTDIVICCGDEALGFMRKFRGEVLGETVVAACGAVRPESLPGPAVAATGVLERHDLPGLLRLIRSLFPSARRLTAVVDSSARGRDIAAELASLNDDPDLGLVVIDAGQMGLERALDSVAAAPGDGVTLLVSLEDTGLPEPEQAIVRVVERSRAPVLCLHRTMLLNGAAGGMLVDVRRMGARAAELAVRALTEGSPPPMENAAAAPVFRLPPLERAGADQAALPEGSLLLDAPHPEPEPLLASPWALVAGAVGGGLVLIVLLRLRRRSRQP